MTDNSGIEKLTVDAYSVFYRSHKKLFKDNISEYWTRASRYKDYYVQRNSYTYTTETKSDFDPTEDIYK